MCLVGVFLGRGLVWFWLFFVSLFVGWLFWFFCEVVLVFFLVGGLVWGLGFFGFCLFVCFGGFLCFVLFCFPG